MKDSLKKVKNFEKQLDLEMSKSQYLFEAQNFLSNFMILILLIGCTNL